MDGISSLHGRHHVAQKFRKTSWPRSSFRPTEPDPSRRTVKSGAAVGRPSRMKSRSAKGSAAAPGSGTPMIRQLASTSNSAG